MRKSGGIIAIIAGAFGIIAAGITLVVGGLGSAFEAEGASTVVGLGWGGVVFSFVTIILGAIAMNAKSRVPGSLLILCAVAGAILGGTLVAVFMVLALCGGIIAILGVKKDVASPTTSTATPAGWLPDPTGRYQLRYWSSSKWTEHVSSGGIQSADPL